MTERRLSIWRGEIGPRSTVGTIAAGIARTAGVSLEELTGPSRRHALAAIRQRIYAECSAMGHGPVQIGRFFGRDHSAVSHGVRAHRRRAENG